MNAEPDGLVERSTRIVLRPLANPLPLGFFALAAGTLLVSALQLEWIAATETSNVALILIAFVAPLQVVTAVLGYLSRDVVAGTGMGILAGTWLCLGIVTFRTPTGTTSDALGLLLLIAAVAMCAPAIGAALGKIVPAAVLFTTAARFAATGVYQLTGASTWKTTAGTIGIVLCAGAVYAAFAMLLEDVRATTTLPLARRGNGRRSMDGNLAHQLATLEREAGVREQL